MATIDRYVISPSEHVYAVGDQKFDSLKRARYLAGADAPVRSWRKATDEEVKEWTAKGTPAGQVRRLVSWVGLMVPMDQP